MTEKSGNTGIMVTGGHFEAKTAVAGKNARGETKIYESNSAITLQEVRAEIDRMLSLYRSEKGALSPDEERAAVEIRTEIQKPQPQKSKLDLLLGRLGSNAKSISSVAAAITAVQKLVTLLVL